MRIKIDIDKVLLNEAFTCSKASTVEELIHEALEVFIWIRRRKDLTELAGRIQFRKDYDHKALRTLMGMIQFLMHRSFETYSAYHFNRDYFCFSRSLAWACPLELPTVHVVVMGHDLTIELATTPEARTCGLSLRDSLPANRGMLFVYAEPEILTFWMKNTRMPLSIAFIDADGRVVSIQKMNPFPTTTVYASPVPALYALEVNQGWFEENEVNVGDVVEFVLPITLDIR